MDNSWSQLSANETTWFHWTSAILGSFIVGLSGIIPLLFLPQKVNNNQIDQGKKNLNRQLSFAVGGLLGDVFLHLIPEAYASKNSKFIRE